MVSLEDLDPRPCVCWMVVYCTQTALPLLPLSSLSIKRAGELPDTGDLGV